MRRLWLVASLMLAALGVLFVLRQPLLIGFADFLILDEPRVSADAIVVLGGSLPDRMLEAVDLYHAGLAPKIILGREPSNPGTTELERRGVHIPERHELNVQVAERLGVAPQALVVIDGRPNSTVTEAEIIIPYLRRDGIRRALIVTSKIHTYRSGLTYRTLAPDLQFTLCATRYDSFEPQRWWHSRGNVRRVIFEYQKLLVFLLKDRW